MSVLRAVDGTFYEVPDSELEQFKVPPDQVKGLMEGAGQKLLRVRSSNRQASPLVKPAVETRRYWFSSSCKETALPHSRPPRHKSPPRHRMRKRWNLRISTGLTGTTGPTGITGTSRDEGLWIRKNCRVGTGFIVPTLSEDPPRPAAAQAGWWAR